MTITNTARLISVIVPVYNVKKYIEICLNSILQQTYNNLEIIVIDDGSTDGSGKICDEFKLKDSRIQVYHKANGGLSSARNYGLRCFSGEYIIFIDSDDWIEKKYIENLYVAAEKYRADIVCCGKTIAQTNKSFIEVGCDKELILSSEEVIKKSLFDEEISVAAWGKIYSGKIFDKIFFPEGEIHEDAAIMYRIFDQCNKIVVIPQYGYFYRFNAEGISKQNYSPQFNVVLTHTLDNQRFISKKYPRLRIGAQAAVADVCISMLIKIFETPAGYTQFKKEAGEYQRYLRRYAKSYKVYRKTPLKRTLWMLMFLCPPQIGAGVSTVFYRLKKIRDM